MKKSILIVIMLKFFLMAETIEDAKKLFYEEKYDQAFTIFKSINNSPETDYFLAKSYRFGYGTKIDQKKAFLYAKKSAKRNYTKGICQLASFYQNGIGTVKDYIKSLYYYKYALEQNSTRAMIEMAFFHEDGTFVKKDHKKAEYYYKLAIEHGDIVGLFWLASESKDNRVSLKYIKQYLKQKNHDDISPSYLKIIGDIFRKNKQYEKAYNFYLKAVKKDYYRATPLLVNLTFKKPLQNKAKEAMYYAELVLKKISIEKENDVKLYEILSIELYHYNLYIKKNYNKAIDITKKLYENGNLEFGCYLSSVYETKYISQSINYNLNDSPKEKFNNFKKSYTLANEIIKKSKDNSSNISSCYSVLSYYHKEGKYISLDYNKSILLQIESFTRHKHLQEPLAQSIANDYLELLNDKKNAAKWYQKAYELTKDKIYLQKIKKISTNLITDKKNISQKNIFPIVKKSIYDIKRYKSGRHTFIVDSTNTIKIYKQNALKPYKTINLWYSKNTNIISKLKFNSKNKILYCLIFDSKSIENGKPKVIAIDINSGNIIKKYNLTNIQPSFTKFSLHYDGKYLLVLNEKGFNVIDTKNNNIQVYKFNGETDKKLINGDIVKKGNDYFAYILNEKNKILIYSLKEKLLTSMIDYKGQISFQKNNTETIWDNDIKVIYPRFRYFDNKLYCYANSDANLTDNIEIFDMKKLELSTKKLKNIIPVFDVQEDLKSQINIKLENNNIEVLNSLTHKIISSFSLSNYNINISSCKPIENKYILIIAKQGLIIFDIFGNLITRLTTTANSPESSVVYSNNFIYVLGSDNIWHFWSIDDIQKAEKFRKIPLKKVKETMFEMLEVKIDTQLLKAYGFQTEKEFKKYLKNIYIFLNNTLMPTLSLHINKNKEWIIFNKKGFFACSANGKNLIKYRINQKQYQKSKYVELAQVYDTFYRPDIIRKTLLNQKYKTDIDIKFALLNISPPSINIIDYNFIDKSNVNIKYKICDNGNGISNTKFIINGFDREIQKSKDRGFSIVELSKVNSCKIYKNIISLRPGKNKIIIKSYDKKNIIYQKSQPIDIIAKYTLNKIPNLYFVSIAIDNYKNNSLKLKYPVKDAEALENMIKNKSNTTFSSINTYKLFNENVTDINIKKIFNAISKKIKFNDVFILYIAGHGISDKKDNIFYFPYINKVNFKNFKNNSLSITELKTELNKLKNEKSLILIDTCQSGSVINQSIQNKEIVQKLTNNTNHNYIVASTKSQVALEGYKNHGLFTMVLLEAFNNAYFGNDNILTLSSLSAYIEKRVPQISKSIFNYNQIPVKYLVGKDFAIANRY